jgi:excisionase family DNA binding protein
MAEPGDLESIFGDGDGGGSDFLHRFGVTSRAVSDELGVGQSVNVDILFLGFLRSVAQFGLFSFGPVTIYVPLIEEIVARTVERGVPLDEQAPMTVVRFSRALWAEVERSGRRRIDELHVLLAFMRLSEGLPRRVFSELGVTPEQVEAYARTGRTEQPGPGGAPEMEQLYSPEEAAEYLGIHVQTVRAWIRSGRLKAHRLAGQRALRIKASDLMGVLEPVDPEEL